MHRPSKRNASSTALWLAEVLRHAIIMGTLPPDEVVRVDEIAESYEVRADIVREVFALLKRADWIESVSTHSAVVAPLRAKDAIQLFESRAALEVEAAQQSFPELTEHQIAAAEEAHRALENAIDEDRLNAHVNFHLALYAAADASLLEQVEQKIRASERYLCFKRTVLNDRGAEHAEHLAFLHAARVKDVKRAVRIIDAHIANCGRLIAQTL